MKAIKFILLGFGLLFIALGSFAKGGFAVKAGDAPDVQLKGVRNFGWVIAGVVFLGLALVATSVENS